MGTGPWRIAQFEKQAEIITLNVEHGSQLCRRGLGAIRMPEVALRSHLVADELLEFFHLRKATDLLS